MSVLNTIMESEDFQNYIIENKEVFTEVDQKINDFGKVIKSFVLANPNEFMAENIDQVKKNIRVFTEIATSQYMTEVCSILSEQFSENDDLHENEQSNNDYF
jgi:hypothetical protein